VQGGGWSTGCALFDADGDGDLDLYVARYVSTSWNDLGSAQRTLTWRGGPKTMVGPVGLPGEADLFFENRGDGTFTEATDAHGLTDAARAYGFGVVATDYDGDGWIDLYVANDTNPNFLYHNLGNGRFESVGLLSGVALNAEGRGQAGMGVDAGDYDGDGRLDLIVTNFAQDTNTRYHNRDGHLFEDVTDGIASASGAGRHHRRGRPTEPGDGKSTDRSTDQAETRRPAIALAGTTRCHLGFTSAGTQFEMRAAFAWLASRSSREAVKRERRLVRKETTACCPNLD
jgi:FG-GAP-like repeat